jgi:hypothetical protein
MEHPVYVVPELPRSMTHGRKRPYKINYGGKREMSTITVYGNRIWYFTLYYDLRTRWP